MKIDDLKRIAFHGSAASTLSRLMALTAAFSLTSGVGAFALRDPSKPPPPNPAPPTAVVPSPAAKEASGGRMKIEKETLDIGEVVRGQLATGIFEVQNTGSEVLKILEAKPG